MLDDCRRRGSTWWNDGEYDQARTQRKVLNMFPVSVLSSMKLTFWSGVPLLEFIKFF